MVVVPGNKLHRQLRAGLTCLLILRFDSLDWIRPQSGVFKTWVRISNFPRKLLIDWLRRLNCCRTAWDYCHSFSTHYCQYWSCRTAWIVVPRFFIFNVHFYAFLPVLVAWIVVARLFVFNVDSYAFSPVLVAWIVVARLFVFNVDFYAFLAVLVLLHGFLFLTLISTNFRQYLCCRTVFYF